MEEETILSKNMSIAAEEAALDASCRKLLSDKKILAWIMHECVDEYKECSIEEIINNYLTEEPEIDTIAVHPDETAESIKGISNEDVTINEGTIRYDIRFYASVPESEEKIQLIINIEAQNDYYPGYPLLKRAVYYASRLISAQYGTEFKNAQYDKIKKVYTIWICMNPPNKKKNTLTKYKIMEENVIGRAKEEKSHYDLMTIIMLGLGTPEDENYGGILKLLELLLLSEKSANERKELIEEEFKITMSEVLSEEALQMCNISKGFEQRGYDRGIQFGIQQGIQQGMQQGIQQGIQQGMQQGKLETILNIMKMLNIPETQAMKVAGIPEEEYKKYSDLIKQ